LLEDCGKRFGWKLVPEWIRRDKTRSIRIDGALVDEYRLPHGFWEAKDTHDDLAKEVKKKINAGYPQNNIIFQAPERAILWQDGRSVLDVDITEPTALVEVVKQFFDYTPPEFEEWADAVTHFQNQVPELGRALAELIKDEEKSNPRFRAAFDGFPSTPTTKTARTAVRTSPTGHLNSSARITKTNRLRSGTSFITSMPCCIIRSIASAMRRTSNANCRVFLSRLTFVRSQTSANVSPKSTSTMNSSRNTAWKELRSRARSLIGASSG
ncbi:MAG: hypothetical protein QOK48_812, partial [Blastocatellia bacterium]|nr:hypothetical protein [Blastocatellia bacterium]